MRQAQQKRATPKRRSLFNRSWFRLECEGQTYNCELSVVYSCEDVRTVAKIVCCCCPPLGGLIVVEGSCQRTVCISNSHVLRRFGTCVGVTSVVFVVRTRNSQRDRIHCVCCAQCVDCFSSTVCVVCQCEAQCVTSCIAQRDFGCCVAEVIFVSCCERPSYTSELHQTVSTMLIRVRLLLRLFLRM